MKNYFNLSNGKMKFLVIFLFFIIFCYFCFLFDNSSISNNSSEFDNDLNLDINDDTDTEDKNSNKENIDDDYEQDNVNSNENQNENENNIDGNENIQSNNNKFDSNKDNINLIYPPDGMVIKSVKNTSYDITYLEGIYLTYEVNDNYYGLCELQVNSTTSSVSRYVYYYKWNYNKGEYEKVFTNTNGIKYINNSKVDGKIYIQWYLEIEGNVYYTKIYERNCVTNNSEIILTSDYISKIDNRYSKSKTSINVKDSILITTANYQVTLRQFEENSSLANKIINDISNKYIFTAPHSVKQWRNNDFKDSDVKTGAICEILSKLTNSVCISRIQFDKTDPNVDSYNNSRFQQLAVKLVNDKNLKILVDIHGIANGRGFDFAIGTKYGETLFSGDKCELEKKIVNSIGNFDSNTFISLNQNNNYNCGFDKLNMVKLTSSYTGGALVGNVKKNVSIANFSSVQIEISNDYRTSVNKLANTINSIYHFVKK